MKSKAIILFLFLSSVIVKLNAQEKIDVTFESSEDKVLIHYFLHGDPDKDYEITTILRKSGDPSFKLVPDNTSGDIGKGKFAGKNRTIVWNINKSEEDMLSGEDFYFEVTASEIKEGSSWYWYLIGAAAVGGGTATYLLLHKNNNSSPSTVSPSDNVAIPPGRP